MEEDTPDYEALLAAGEENARYKRMMEQQQAQAQMMRERGGPVQGQMVSGHYVAPHALQQLGGLANTIGAAYKDKQAQESGVGLEKSMSGQNQLILKALMRNRQAGQPKPIATNPIAPDLNDY